MNYKAFYFDPSTGAETPSPRHPDAAGEWTAPLQPTFADWVLVLKA